VELGSVASNRWTRPLTAQTGSPSKSKKKKNKKKNATNKADGEDKVNGYQSTAQAEDHDDDAEAEDDHAVGALAQPPAGGAEC
jgi:hypothetical protein